MSAFLSGIWAKVALAAAFVGLALLAILKLLGAGRKLERADAATKAAERTQDANQARAEASQPVTPEEEADDPFNRDRR